MIKQEIRQLIKKKFKQEAKLERPLNSEFGDYSTNLAMQAKIDPDEIIEQLKDNPLFAKIEKAGPGFINFFLSEKALQDELKEILKSEENYGNLDIGQKKKVQVEFISANPTGPLTVANARGGPLGDVLANVLNKAGFKTEKAYYVNDYGQQIIVLGHSVLKDGQGKYQGDYIDSLAEEISARGGLANRSDTAKAGQIAAKYIIKDLIQRTTDKMGIKYDEWIFESDLYQSGRVDKVLDFLKEKGLIYLKEKAQWFKSSQFGDRRDRVMVKGDGSKTYLAGDIALHNYKFKDKKFDKVINIWGADHHGDIAGLMAGVEAIGDKGKLEIILLQFVTILEKGEKRKMSKRAGIYVTMDELLEKAGKDATRFFFLQKSSDTHLNFDINLAQEQSSKNPVYYIQYAHARICSILRKAEKEGFKPSRFDIESSRSNLKLNHPAEISLIKELIKLPETIEDIAQDYQVQRLPYYSQEVANKFHQFYEQCRVIGMGRELTQARLGLIKAVQIVLKNTLELMGISAPEKM
ncbi:MAG: arginine--tRNA ligase [Patescibacteria group bacterium]